MQETILIIYLVVAIALVGLILIQQGKGAEMGASFGAGGANTVFGAGGSGNALTKATTILAVLFFGIALSISYLSSAPKVIKDEIFDEAPAISIDAELPGSNNAATGVETELPPAAKVENDDTTTEVKTEATTPEAEKANDETQSDGNNN